MKRLIKYLQQFKQWILSIVKCRFFLYKKTFHYQPFIYLDEDEINFFMFTDELVYKVFLKNAKNEFIYRVNF